MTKQQLFVRLANFLRHNVSLVSDMRDTNSPWTLLEQLDRYEYDHKKTKKRKAQTCAKN